MPALYKKPAFYVFLATLSAFVLLALTTISVPVLSTFSFLHSTQADGVKFGMWGWCLDDGHTCSPVQFGYTWQPEINGSITKAFVFYPVAIVLTFFTLIATVPAMCARSARTDTILNIFAWSAFSASAMAFLFMIGICGVAKARFEKRGFGASYGNLPWISLAATILLFIVSMNPYYLGLPPKQNQKGDVESRRTVRRWSRGASKHRV